MGDKPEVLETVEKIVVDSGARELEGFSNSSLSDDERWRDYSTFISTYVNAYAHVPGDTQPNNMQAVIFILDKEMSLGARAEELLSRKLGIPPQFQPFDPDVLSRTEEEFRQHVIQFRLLGATALGAMLNPPDEEFPFSYAGISQGEVSIRPAVQHGFRKPSLINAILAKEFYDNHPGARPPRHQGHEPLHLRS